VSFSVPGIGPVSSRAEALRHLRRLLPAPADSVSAPLPLALLIPEIESCLPQGGLERGVVHEIAPAAEIDWAAAFGFAVALLGRTLADEDGQALLVISERGFDGAGKPYGHGLDDLGLPLDRLILIEAGADREALWVLEEGLRSRAVVAVVGCLGGGLDLKASRRLNLAADGAGLSFILRPPAADEPNAAATRWRIASAPALRDRFGAFAGWRWQVDLERCRNGRPGTWIVEFDHVSHRLRLAGTLADRALPDGAEAGSGIRRAG
jgi:protein ImuA